MSSVVDMQQWLAMRAPEAQQYTKARALDFRVAIEGCAHGVPLSHLRSHDFRRVRHLLDMLADRYGPMAPRAVVFLAVNETSHYVVVSRAATDAHGLRWPDAAELRGFDCMHFAEFEIEETA